MVTVMLQLAAEHVPSLDDTAEERLPGLVHGNAHDGSKITIRRLLGHTSGIADYLRDQEAVNRYESPTPRQLVQVAMSHPASFQPGASWEYCQTDRLRHGRTAPEAPGWDGSGRGDQPIHRELLHVVRRTSDSRSRCDRRAAARGRKGSTTQPPVNDPGFGVAQRPDDTAPASFVGEGSYAPRV
nr:serine hydrolase domain-containing protein [Planomonospora sp. ID67723]